MVFFITINVSEQFFFCIWMNCTASFFNIFKRFLKFSVDAFNASNIFQDIDKTSEVDNNETTFVDYRFNLVGNVLCHNNCF